MRPRQGIQIRVITRAIVLALLLHPFANAQEPVPPQASGNHSQIGEPASPQQDTEDSTVPPSTVPSPDDQLPDSPGVVQSRTSQPQAMAPEASRADNNQSSDTEPTQSQQSDPATAPAAQVPAPPPGRPVSEQLLSDQINSQTAEQAPQQQQTPPQALGTAAAESVQTTGVPASRPAGAAVAPAKQRRVRSILIKVGALVGVGVAVGTTMALSQGSPSRPPGSN